MAFTTTQLEALRAALGSGELEVTFDGKTVKYRSVAELNSAYQLVRSELIADGVITDPRKRVSVTAFSKD